MTAVVVGWGQAGWLALGALFVLATLPAPALTRRALRARARAARGAGAGSGSGARQRELPVGRAAPPRPTATPMSARDDLGVELRAGAALELGDRVG